MKLLSIIGLPICIIILILLILFLGDNYGFLVLLIPIGCLISNVAAMIVSQKTPIEFITELYDDGY